MSSKNIAAVILAAGESRRLGRPKQLLTLNSNETLLQRSVRQVSQLGISPLVVLGAYWQKIVAAIPDSLPMLVINADWQRGMSSSLAAALQRVPADTQGLLVCVCDQARIPDTHYAALLEQFNQDRSRAVATLANNIVGVPAILPTRAFAALLSTGGDKGARNWLRNDTNVMCIECPEAAFDIDTAADIDVVG